jgi:GNAT superfamily N-acetyltransferase
VPDKVRRVNVDDAGAIAEILADGFSTDPVMLWVFGTASEDLMQANFEFIVREALIPLGATWMTDDCCAAWTPAGRAPWAVDELSERFLNELGPRLNRDQLDRLITLNAVTAGLHAREPHWYLAMIATRHVAQGTGAGGRLLRHTLRQVDADTLPAYLESTNPANIAFYERNGFAICGAAKLPDGPTLTKMSRPPLHD